MTKEIKDRNLLLSAIFFFVALLPSVLPTSSYSRLVFFLMAGIFSAWFYGKHDHEVWPNEQKPTPYGQIHAFWVHVLGGISAGAAAFILFDKVNINKLELSDLILFLILVLGYSGYIPRTLWFIANKGGLSKKINI